MRGTPTVQTVYYDAVCVVETATKGPRAGLVKKAFYNVRHGPFAAVILQVALGGALAVILRRYEGYEGRRRANDRLLDAIEESGVDIERGLIPINPEKIRKITGDLGAVDPLIAGTDLVIIATVLSDPNSVRLITWDSALLGNERLDAYERKMRRDGLRNAQLRITNGM